MLTANQNLALDFQNHLSVTANAGAGKTTVLVQRFVDILTRTGTPVNRLVAITFTERAASELRKKIAEEIVRKISGAHSRREMEVLQGIRDQFASAHIQTIHSFCAQLLREYPVEAEVDAAFTVLEGVDRQILQSEALQKTFESILSGPVASTDREQFLDLIRFLGRKRVQSYLGIFLNKREQLGRMLREHDGCLALNLSEEDVLGRWNQAIMNTVTGSLDDPTWRECLRTILKSARGKNVDEISSLLTGWSTGDPAPMKIDLYRDILSRVFTTDGKLKKAFTGTSPESEMPHTEISLLTRHYDAERDIIASLTNENAARADLTLLRSVRILLRTYGTALENYHARKFENGQLDFEDLQLKTRELLQNVEIQKNIAEKYSFIMVDEFQDTNQLQSDILQLLISNFQTGNLFIVGDPKQSIYGFRNAEVEIFEETKKRIAASYTPGIQGSVTLAESFRLLTGIVDFVNRVFSRTMTQSTSRFEVAYDELIRGRDNPEIGNIELLLVRQSGDGEEAERGGENPVTTECRMITQKIIHLFESKHIVFHPRTEKPQSFRFRDAAILLRSRRHLQELEQALVEAKIPYILSGGIGFYQTQEILDFLNYFKFLLDPEDDVALAGLLRSPFFAVSDADLFEISLRGKEETFWNKTRDCAGKQENVTRLTSAVEILSEDLLLVNRLPIPFLVQRVLHRTGWHGTIAGLRFGGQNAANIRKLLRIAREYEGKGLLSLYDFVERLKTLTADEEREGQASAETIGDCVSVLTVHAAKGLEFPVVFLPFAHRKFQYDRPPYMDPDLGIAFNMESQNGDENLSSPFCHLLHRFSVQRTEAEEKRIFYVGCTRARDMLVISGRHEGANPSYLKWVVEGLSLDVPPESGEIVLPSSPVKILERNGDQRVLTEVFNDLRIAVTVSGVTPKVKPLVLESSEPESTSPEILIDPLPGKFQGDFFSATQIRTFLECPTKYYLKYFLGLPERQAYYIDEEEESSDILIGEEEGKLTHAVLQTLTNRSNLTNDELRARVRMVVSGAPGAMVTDRDAAVEAITSNVSNFLQSPFGREILSVDESMAEFSISATFGDDYLTGTLDRIYKDHEGKWNIVDFKTDGVPARDLGIRAAIYKPQVALYSLLVSQLYGQDAIRASIVFLSHPQKPIHYLFTKDEINEFETTVRDVVMKIKGRKFEREVLLCATCTYQADNRCLLKCATGSSPDP